jgi:hypothetical protein
VLTSYLLSKSLGDCLPEEAIPVPGICKLTAKSAFMVVLSLVTSAAYLGCKPISLACVSFRLRNGAKLPQFSGVWLCVQTKSCKCRTSLSCGARDGSWKSVAWCATATGKSCSRRSEYSQFLSATHTHL